MTAVIYGLHLMVVVALIFMVLMQRSEGGALGMGGSSNSMMTGRGAADALARGTGILGAIFFATSMTLTLMAGGARAPASVVDQPAGSALNISFDPVVQWFEGLGKGAPSQPVATPTPAPTLPAPAATATLPTEPAPTQTGDVAPAPAGALTRAAPLPEPPVTPPAALTRPAVVFAPPRPASATPAAAQAPAVRSVTSPAPAAVSGSNNAQSPAAASTAKPPESSESQVPAARPRGRAGPDE